MKHAILELTRIVQAVALVDAPAEQVKLIVDSISHSIDVDVCSLYRVNERQEMVLLASHGLTVTDQIILPAGKGLVGLVAQNRHSVNIADAASHPDYFYLPQTNEERFHSFCGVPLVRNGKVIGVLVVQSERAQQLSEEDEAFLVTLASQLALIVAELPRADSKPSKLNHYARGIKGAPGIGIGFAQLCVDGELNHVRDAECEDIDAELIKWHELLNAVRADINAEQRALGSELPESVAAIFDAYQMLLADQSLIDKVEQEIRAGHWLPGALRLSINYFAELFRAMDDVYLKARHEDILHLGNKLFNAWRGTRPSEPSFTSTGPIILVGTQVSVSEIAGVPAGQLAGVVCFEGASLSHTAVLANAMGVPAVMGIGMLKSLRLGDALVVDGNVGQVIVHPSEMVIAEYRQLMHQDQLFRKQLDALRDQPAETKDGVVVKLFTNTGLLADISPGLRSGAEGVGLYRTEIPFMVRDSFPTEEEQFQVYQKVFDAYRGKPVYMRTLDIGGDKQLPYFSMGKEENPALGWRGIRFTLDNIQLMMTQVRAMIKASEGGENLYILLPMVSSTNEIDTFRELLDDACLQLRDEGVAFYRPKFGVMVEVPAAISLLPFWAKKIDFVSVGSNDLSQYLLALDRNNTRVAARYDLVHPAVLHELYRVVTTAKAFHLPLSFCGEMASDPVAVILLLGMGIRSLSMSASKLPKIKWVIRSISIRLAEDLFGQALQMDRVEAIRELVNDALNNAGLGELVN